MGTLSIKAHEDEAWGHFWMKGVPYGGPLNGRDLDGEYFTAETNLCPEWSLNGLPILYHHGLDPAMKTTMVGRTLSRKDEDDGVWYEAQLEKGVKYTESINRLIKKNAIHPSSGAYAHLVKKAPDGFIEVWPLVEMSLTPTPANPDAIVTTKEMVSATKAIKLLSAVDASIPDELAVKAAEEKAAQPARKNMKGDGQGGGTLSDQDVCSRIESLLKEWSASQMVVSEDPLMDMEEEAEECYWWVDKAYSASSYVVARKSGDYQLYRVDYTVMGNTVSISEPRPVEAITSYVATKANRVLSTATLDHMDAMKGHAQAGMDACKAIMSTVDEMKGMAGGMVDGENEAAIKASAVLSAALKQKMQHATHTATGGENAFKAIKDTATMLLGGYDSTPVASTDATATKALEDTKTAHILDTILAAEVESAIMASEMFALTAREFTASR